MNEKGVNEIVGTLMILLVVSITVTFLYVSAHPVITNSQENIKYRNSHFDLLDLKDKLDRIRFGLESNATVKITLSHTSVELKNRPILSINSTNYSVSSISFKGNDWDLVFENGAVIERRGNSALMLSSPNLYFQGDTLNMPVISFKGNISAAGSGSRTFTAALINSTLLHQGPADIKLYTENKDAWRDYFDEIGLSHSVSGNEITSTVQNSHIVLYEVRLQ
ncbi:MAG: hypothetical protein ACLFO6_08085 [Archaeoglobaceae archaeon]